MISYGCDISCFYILVRTLFAVVLLLLLTLCVNQDIFVQFHAASLFPLPFLLSL